MNVALAAFTVAAYRAFRDMDVDDEDATGLIADVAWAVYRRWGGLADRLTRGRRRPPLDRLRRNTNLFRRFPFGPPAYVMEDVAEPDAVGFDVRRCPAAEVFAVAGLPDLCVATWCSQDFALAEAWGGTLERTQTIAEGADRCDFRWRARANAPAPIRRGGQA